MKPDTTGRQPRPSRRRTGRWSLVLVPVLALLLAACGEDADEPDDVAAEPDDPADEPDEDPADEPDEEPVDAEFTLNYSSFSTEGAAFEQVNSWALDEIEARTGGRVTFERFLGEGLLQAEDMLQGAIDGRSELTAPSPSYHPAELPLTQVTTLPFITTDTEAHSRAIVELYRTNDAFRSEFEDQGVVMLWPHPLTISILCTTEPVDGLDDLQGQQIRALGYVNEALAEIGANPQAMPIPEVFEALERGVLDGASGTIWEGLPSSRVHEVAPHCYDPGIGQYTSTFTIINRDQYESLPDDIQQAFQDVIDESIAQIDEIYADVDQQVCEEVQELGGTAGVFPEEDQQRWQDEVQQDIVDQWLQEAEGAGAEDPQSVLDDYLGLIDEFEGESQYTPGVRACAEEAFS